MEKNNFKETIKEVMEVVEELGLKVSDTEIVETSCKIYLSQEIQGYKQANIQSINQDKKVAVTGSKPIENKSNEPLTEKQKNFLIKNDYRGSMAISKKEASVLIDEFIKGRSERGEY